MSSMYLLRAFILLTIGLVFFINISESTPLNWKQCTWNNGLPGIATGNGIDIGVIHSCAFFKKATNTYLRVVYQGNISMFGRSRCSRWYFTFNGNECSGPVPIEGIHSTRGTAIWSQRAVTIEGLCSGIQAGIVNVNFNVGVCTGILAGNAYTNFRSHSRVIIEEVNEPQP